jgi:hypothetical protein
MIDVCTFELSATVEQAKPWGKAIKDSCPRTLPDSLVYKIGDLYRPAYNRRERTGFVIVRFPNFDGGWKEAIAWMNKNQWTVGRKLRRSNPRELLAVCRQNDLRELLGGIEYMILTASEDHFYFDCRHSVYVSIDRCGQSAVVGDVNGLGVIPSHRFLFRIS